MQKTHKRTPFFTSAFLSAVALFGVVNGAAGRVHTSARDFEKYGHPTWTWWTLKDFQASQKSPNIGMLGSSLMVTAISLCDAAQAHKTLDLSEYRNASYFDSQLHKRIGCSLNTFNFSAPGQMPSDAFMTLQAALDCGAKPDCIVYGLGPRDFIDGTMQQPADTETYKLLGNLVDLKGSDLDFYSTPLEKLEYVLSKSMAVGRFGLPAKDYLSKEVAALESANTAPQTETSRWMESTIRAANNPYNLGPNAMFATAEAKFQKPEQLAMDIINYRSRYGNPKPVTYTTQFRFLKRIAHICRSHQISLVLVNMPLPETNKKLLRTDLHDKYIADLADFGQKNNVQFLDLDDSRIFKPSDFRDIAHLNGEGGKKLIDTLLDRAAPQSPLRETFMAAARAAEFRQLASSPDHQI